MLSYAKIICHKIIHSIEQIPVVKFVLPSISFSTEDNLLNFFLSDYTVSNLTMKTHDSFTSSHAFLGNI